MKKTLIIYFTITFIITGFLFLENPDDKYPGVSLIKSENLLKTVGYLSSPELAGRMGGSEGYFKAANFIADEFKKIGLKPLGNKEYFQTLNVEYNEILSPCVLRNINRQKTYKLGNDFVCRGFTGSGNVTAEVVFVGYGFSEDFYNDYTSSVAGKIVLMFKQTPNWKIGNNEWNQSLRYRASKAYSYGAVAVLFVSRPNDINPQKPIGSVMDGEGKYIPDLPMLHIDISVADEFLGKSGETLINLQRKIDSLKSPCMLFTDTQVHIEVNSKYKPEKETVNVIGMLEGSDEVLKNEYIVIGAHLDHAGSQAGEIYFPGANDNASGSASVLEIARTYVNSGIKPKRSIIFALFSNEESGLEGSEYFVKNSPVPLNKITAMLNNDCIGHGDSIQIGNGKSAPLLWEVTRKIDSSFSRLMIDRTWNGGGADATPFHKAGIPSLYFVSFFSYTHLHLQSDKPETLNPSLFESVCRLGYMTSYEIAMGNYIKETVL